MTVALDCLCVTKFWRLLCLRFPGVDMKILVREKVSKTKLNDRKIVTENMFVLKYFWINNIRLFTSKIQGALSLFVCFTVCLSDFLILLKIQNCFPFIIDVLTYYILTKS